MQTGPVSPDTQATLLLCGHFSPKETAPVLDGREFGRLTGAMPPNVVNPSSLLEPGTLDRIDWEIAGLQRSRVEELLERGAALALAVERWTSAGIWVLSRADSSYPNRLCMHLNRSAPMLLFGVGDARKLDRGGLAIVGSRDIDGEAEAFTARIAGQCAREGISVVSGGARGVDEIALAAAFTEGGNVVAVLPEGVGKASLAAKYREGIREDRLVLVSPYAPHAPFSVGNAMGRNKLIYACADAALVVSSALRTGGTWAGAEDELKREHARPVFVRRLTPPIDGNEALLALGAQSFPDERHSLEIRGLLEMRMPALARVADRPITPRLTASVEEPEHTSYEALQPRLLELLTIPRTAEQIAGTLGGALTETKKWLDRAVRDGAVVKSGRPARFRRAEPAQQPSLFGD
jgi:predicted Rossmann fold nucleotide-binding protein DprA/Smf involved in DNA uptake